MYTRTQYNMLSHYGLHDPPWQERPEQHYEEAAQPPLIPAHLVSANVLEEIVEALEEDERIPLAAVRVGAVKSRATRTKIRKFLKFMTLFTFAWKFLKIFICCTLKINYYEFQLSKGWDISSQYFKLVILIEEIALGGWGSEVLK